MVLLRLHNVGERGLQGLIYIVILGISLTASKYRRHFPGDSDQLGTIPTFPVRHEAAYAYKAL
jgi:hypothetical protein